MANLVGKVLRTTHYGRMIRVEFALIVRQTPKCVFLKFLPQIETYADPLRYAGTTVPDLSKLNTYLDLPSRELVRAKVEWQKDGTFDCAVSRETPYWLWDGTPLRFDHMD